MNFNLVVGMHRSGTSVLSGLLHNTDVNMGEGHFKPRPNETNAKGFFEDIRFRKVNDNILKFNRYDVKSWSTSIPVIEGNKSLRKQIKGVLGQVSGEYVGFKDPRTCLTWHLWEPFLPAETVVYFIYRNPVSVAKSLQKRNNIDLETAYKLWNLYNQRASRIAWYFDTVFVSYEDLMDKGSQETIGVPDIKNLIDRDLYHHPPEEIPQICHDVWQTLKNSK